MLASHPWIQSAKSDMLGIFLPGLLSVVLVLILGTFNQLPISESPWVWLLLVVFIDVAHVWSTLFRTYLNKFAAKEFEKELFLIPLMCWLFGTGLYILEASSFWRVMAYIAVYHFIKQQVGIYKIYRRSQPRDFWYKYESVLIYSMMLYPLIHWHTQEKSFFWFEKGDFFQIPFPLIDSIAFGIFLCMIFTYIGHLIKRLMTKQILNIPALLLLITTGLVWFVGIVAYDNDFAFTLTNVVNHGLPYLYLIAVSSLSRNYTPSFKGLSFLSQSSIFRKFFFMFVIILILGYFEETFWDLFVWHEHKELFPYTKYVTLDHLTSGIVVGLLITPQLSHYLLDGVIWKKNRKVGEFKF